MFVVETDVPKQTKKATNQEIDKLVWTCFRGPRNVSAKATPEGGPNTDSLVDHGTLTPKTNFTPDPIPHPLLTHKTHIFNEIFLRL